MAHATMAAASALATGNLSSHLSRPYAASDSRLLTNLIKSERNYINNLHSSVMSAHAASSALSAWGTSEARDVSEASARVADLLSASADVQSTHVSAIEGYRAALKDVADREASIRNVVRDRDILVGRLIKASNKSVNDAGKSKKSPEQRVEKVHMAQRELQACEEILAQEEAALVGVKRRTFKEALTMRMKTMGDAGAAMVEAAKKAILLLDEFDSNANQRPHIDSYDNNNNNNHHEWYSYPDNSQSIDERNTSNQQNNFEIASVTPSQSASQIYQPQYAQRNSAACSAPFRGIGENEAEAQQRYSQQQQQGGDETDSDEEDWKRSFGQGQDTIVHQGGATALPAPHQLSADTGAHRSFMPYANDATFGPAPPSKDSEKQSISRAQSTASRKNKSKTSDRFDEFGPPTSVNMPPIPTAPRLNNDGVCMEPVPTAPKLYMAGASGDLESSVDTYNGRGGASRLNGQNHDDASSDGERTARQSGRPGGPKRGNSFFGRMGRLFKTDVKGGDSKSQGRSRKGSVGSSTWNTRTDALARETRKMAGPQESPPLIRRSSALTGPLTRDGPDSSDEEPIDEKNAIRVTNPKRSMWQAPKKASSDNGTRNVLSNQLTRPGSLRRTPSASVTPGPASWKSQQGDGGSIKADSIAAHAPTAPPLVRSSSVSTSVKKKKKKSKAPSVGGGSEIGTDSTRTRLEASDGVNQRHSVIVPGDASAGVRTSNSLNYGSTQPDATKLTKKSSKRRSAASTQSLYGTNSTSKIGAMSASDRQSKFSTSNWIPKSNLGEEPSTEPVLASIPVPAAPSSPKRNSTIKSTPATPSKLKQSLTAESVATIPEDEVKPKYAPQPSASMSPPLKPALKVPGSIDLVRSGSVGSSGSVAPSLPPPMSAPPPVTSINYLGDHALKTASAPISLDDNKRMSIEQDNRFDGTSRLGVSDYQDLQPQSQKEERKVQRISPLALPRIDMPKSEPFSVDLENRGGERLSGQEASESGELMTPGERSAYQSFYLQNETPDKAPEIQPSTSSVTRFTDRIASVGRGVLGIKTGSPQKASAQPNVTSPASPTSPELALPPPGKLSRTYSDQKLVVSSDSSEDEAVPTHMVTPATPTSAAPPQPSVVDTPSIQAPPTHPAAPASSVDGGSAIGRRKSVRMASSVKLPPESPALPDLPKASDYTSSNYTTPGSQLSSRIAPPPQAPPRISASKARNINIGANPREVSGWSIRTPALDDSSEEEEDEYQQARKSFGSATRSWGKSTKKNSGTTAASEGGSIKKKKKKATSSSGYNPTIPLPKGMEVVGRSQSLRR